MKSKLLDKLNVEIQIKFKDRELVLGNGNANSLIMLIGEAPGSKEIEQGKPFVGQAGKHLGEFLNKVSINREDLYITNTVKFRPTKESKKTGNKINRPPTSKEIFQFKEYLFKEINIVSPKIVVTLGNTPLKTVLQNKDITIGECHGKLIQKQINDEFYKIFPLYHPAAVIYRRNLKEVYLKDLKKLSTYIEEMQKDLDKS